MLTAQFEERLLEVLNRSRGHRSVLMCAEALPWRCHRC
ncbi:MAG: DUF488 family protein [Planctomycetota bacterium]|nr:MAG: DUF488 family protein [Planctomycetota bacterium]